jgi:hypothetical protein
MATISILEISGVSFTGFNVKYTGSEDISNSILTIFDGVTELTHTLTSPEATDMNSNNGLSLLFTDFASFSAFQIDFPYTLNLISNTAIPIGSAVLILGSTIGIPYDTTLSSGKVILTNCNGCDTLYYGEYDGIDLSGSKTQIMIPAVNSNEALIVPILWPVSLVAGQQYIIWIDADNGNTNGTQVHAIFEGPTEISKASISEVTVDSTNTSAIARFINCRNLDTLYGLFIGVDDGQGIAQDVFRWSNPISEIDSDDFTRTLEFADFSGFTASTNSSYVLWIDDLSGATYGAPGSSAIAYRVSTPIAASTTYYITISYDSIIFKGQFDVNKNITNNITSFADVNSLGTNLLGTGGADSLPGQQSETNDFHDTANGLMFGLSNNDPSTSVNYWTYLDITQNDTLQEIANSLGSGYNGIALYNLNGDKNVWVAFKSGEKEYSSEQATVSVSSTSNEKLITVENNDTTGVTLLFSDCNGLTGQYIFANIKMASGSPPYLPYKYVTSASDLITTASEKFTLNWEDFTK